MTIVRKNVCERTYILYQQHSFFFYSTLGRSWLDLGFDHNPVLNNSGLAKIAAKYDSSIPQVVLRWAMWENVATIPRSSDPKHIALNFAAQFLPLSEQDIEYVRSLQGLISEDDFEESIGKLVSLTLCGTCMSRESVKLLGPRVYKRRHTC